MVAVSGSLEFATYAREHSITCSICCRVMSWNCMDTISLLKPSESRRIVRPTEPQRSALYFVCRGRCKLAERLGSSLGKFFAFCSACSMGEISEPALSNAISTLDWTSAVNDLTSSARVPNSLPALPSLAVSIRVKTPRIRKVETVPLKAVRVRLPFDLSRGADRQGCHLLPAPECAAISVARSSARSQRVRRAQTVLPRD